VETFRQPLPPVYRVAFSTDRSHRANRLREPQGAVFPIVHTPYDFYERI
jgi:hypothetical protein